jgi:hypothetical protein
MAWVTPAPFVVDEILTAAKLNQLVDAVAFLNGLSAGPIPPMRVIVSTNNVAVTTNFYLRHRSNYLHVVTTHNGANRLNVTINGVLRHSTPPVSGLQDTVIDLSSFGLSVGAFVSVDVEIRADTAKSMSLLYLTELASAAALV